MKKEARPYDLFLYKISYSSLVFLIHDTFILFIQIGRSLWPLALGHLKKKKVYKTKKARKTIQDRFPSFLVQ
jgi:hypothetical protein